MKLRGHAVVVGPQQLVAPECIKENGCKSMPLLTTALLKRPRPCSIALIESMVQCQDQLQSNMGNLTLLFTAIRCSNCSFHLHLIQGKLCLCVQLARLMQLVPDVLSSQAISTTYAIVVPDARSNKRVCDEVKDILNSLKHGIDQCTGAHVGV